MRGYAKLTDAEILELIEYAHHTEPSAERTEKVARLGRHFCWWDVAIRHDEESADALPDEFWEQVYDSNAEALDCAVLWRISGMESFVRKLLEHTDASEVQDAITKEGNDTRRD